MVIAVLGIDLGKTICSVAGLDERGAVVLSRRVQRFRLLDFLSSLPPCVVAMEVCGGAHHIGRFCIEQGHEPRLTSPLSVTVDVSRKPGICRPGSASCRVRSRLAAKPG